VFFPKPAKLPDWSSAVNHLRRDRVLRRVIDRVGSCTLAPRRDPFNALVRAIYAQQISTVIATTLYGRLCEQFPRRTPTPAGLLRLLTAPGNDELVRHCGLSRQKRAYLIDLAEHFLDGRINPRSLRRLEDEAVIDALTDVHGIGRWTAEMFLIFQLNRPDVLPVDDLGVRDAVRRFYQLPDRPRAEALRRVAEAWAPYRSIATWYLWRGAALPA
jgi:DNA-3-methyladenine glycosylase II